MFYWVTLFGAVRMGPACCAQGIVLHGPDQPLRAQRGALAATKDIASVDASSSLKDENYTLRSRNGH